jgi:homeobox protein cut-like
MLQAQRERLRKRNEELEEEQTRLTSQLLAIQGEVSDLQTDNVKLYEKIRFLQGFQV